MIVLRKYLLRVVRNVLGFSISAVNVAVPKAHHALVFGVPAEEGNIVEIVRGLEILTSLEIHWVNAPSENYLQSLELTEGRIVRLGGAWSLATVWSFLRASAVFTTHGLLGEPRSGRDQLVVNVWHGEGPKGGGKLYPERRLPWPSSDVLVGSNTGLAEMMTSLAEVPRRAYLPVGYPRLDQFDRPLSQQKLAALGLDHERPFVVWMPTFRRATRSDGRLAWSNTQNPQSDSDLSTQFGELFVAAAFASDVQVVVKPHPLDYANREVSGAVLIDNTMLASVGVGLYELLGMSAGLVSDYSAVWVDYLVLDRPIGFFMPDEPDFRAARGAKPGVFDFELPGTDLAGPGGVDRFLVDVLSEGALTSSLRGEARSRLGTVSRGQHAEALVTHLGLDRLSPHR